MDKFFNNLKTNVIHFYNEYMHYVVLIAIFITSLIFYRLIGDDFFKFIIMSINSSSICILLTMTTTDYWQRRKKRRDTYEIRKSILIRSNYILGLIIELWSGMVEYLIDDYEEDNIFSKKYYDIVSEKIDMTKTAPGAWGSYLNFYDEKRSNIISMINLWIQAYGNHIDPQLLSILSRIELCNMIQYNANMEYLKHNNWVADTFQKNAPKTGHKFYITWDNLEKDFKLFDELKEKIHELKCEFSKDLSIEVYSFNKPIFNIKKSYAQIESYNYDPFYNLASKFDIKTICDRLGEHDDQLKFFMRKSGITPRKTGIQSFIDALFAESEKMQEDACDKQN